MERKKEIIKSILFYYSLIILALLVLVGLGASKSLQDYVNTFLFVPGSSPGRNTRAENIPSRC